MTDSLRDRIRDVLLDWSYKLSDEDRSDIADAVIDCMNYTGDNHD